MSAPEILTFGCRLNAVEAEALRGLAGGGAIVNTCAVTAEAGRQARKAIRRLARERPGLAIAVTGCGAEVEAAAYRAMPEVARLVGNAAKLRPEAWSEAAWSEGRRAGAAHGPGGVMAARAAEPVPVAARAGYTRAFVPVQNGCDHRCTFCVIPFGRGPSRSVPAGAVVEQVARVVAAGGREAVLTGVDLTAYGRDLPDGPSLGGLVRLILRAVPDLARLRLSSIDAVEVDAALLAALAEEPRLMPHLHLSLQAGDDLVLKRMRRRHTRAEAIALCARARALRPGLAVSADLIAGFPTETEAQFARTLELVEECGLAHLHAFPYSPRPGTPAARMPQVAEAVVRERAARLRAAGAAALVRHLDARVGRRLTVLTERGGTGRAEDFTPVRLAGDPAPGALVAAEIAGHDGARLIAA